MGHLDGGWGEVPPPQTPQLGRARLGSCRCAPKPPTPGAACSPQEGGSLFRRGGTQSHPHCPQTRVPILAINPGRARVGVLGFRAPGRSQWGTAGNLSPDLPPCAV